MLSLLIDLLIFCLIAGLFYWVIGMIPLPPPVKQVVTVIFVVVCCIFLIYLLLGLVHGGGYPLLR